MKAGEDQLKQWMIGGLSGDAAAHASLLRAIVPLLRVFYQRRCGSQAEFVEDLVQEVLIAVHTRRATYDVSRPFSGWLFAIARYKMIDHFRRNGRTVAMDDIEDVALADDFEASSIARLDVNHLLDTLPAKQAHAIRATHIDGLSVAEAADRAGIGQSDIKVSVHRGIKALAARIRGDA
ncbi:MAG: sigma-70 family RNA polymerase sigma factor [Sphingobium phenoxybenzoativorans]|uniref:sigma-70 family RNA polymerase sigma factor n=1 Tax=Sphingobium phenoxybenzoativorans TaxID=1592790 RepID=UPI000871CBC8|nr:sigma-70 family RNA polymerase sigma factor [Sphingobium phenoxybenzoativorans]